MVKIKILLENYSINNLYKTKHGLSILIQLNNSNILLDVGPDNKFIRNADKMGINLQNVTILFLSHNHNDHTGGLNGFCRINKTAPIYLMDDIKNRYYVKVKFLLFYIGSKLNKKYHSRIIKIDNDLIIDKNIFLLKNSVNENIKPTLNKLLFKKENGKIINDKFDHESILVLEDNNELLIFNSCSHNGILNIIETVKRKFPNKKIRSYIGGLHLGNAGVKFQENNEYLDFLAEKLRKLNINIYTGHCTGKPVLNYLRQRLGNVVHEINTGMELDV